MRILIASAQFGLGGTESYAVTVGEQFERMGHPTTLFTPHATSAGRELAAARGLALHEGDPMALGEDLEADVALVQDVGIAYALARLGVPQVFVTHGLLPFEQPAQGLDPVPPAIAFNDRIANRLRQLAGGPEVVRMRQPIDIERFRPRSAGRQRTRRVLVFSNYLDDARLSIVRRACDNLGLELVQRGATSEAALDPREAMADADIVVGYGRSILEGMAMGRAAYVWDRGGGDGWVTPDTYATIEADGFSGAATETVIDAERMTRDFAAYSSELGTVSTDLVRLHHSAAKHAEALVPLLDRAPAPGGEDVHATLALLARAEARAGNRAAQFEAEMGRLAARAEEAQRLAASEREARRQAEAQLQLLLNSRTWRLRSRLRQVGSQLLRRRS